MGVSINIELLDKAIDWFADYIVYNQKGGSVDFYNGYMQSAEGYKREIFKAGHAAISCEAWTENDIGTGKILKCVIAGFNAKSNKGFNNIVDFHQITKFQNEAEENMALAEDILFRLFRDEVPAQALEDMCVLWGRWYPEWSYLLFLRDDTKYLPVKNSEKNHYDRFRKLGLDVSCLQSCTWENYKEFIAIHEMIREVLVDRFDVDVSLLDAHSFVWTLYNAPADLSSKYAESVERIKGGSDFVSSIRKRKEYSKHTSEIISEIEEDFIANGVKGKEREVLIKARVNQGVFRERLLFRYKKCCLCGVSNERLLTASHIKPWSASTEDEKLDPDNGLILCPNHDALFDGGWITFDDNGNIVISDNLSDVDRLFLNVRPDMKIEIREKNKAYLEYHREEIFIK